MGKQIVLATQTNQRDARGNMLAREHAHRLQLAPEGIRRQLGWYIVSEPDCEMATLYLLPATLG